jgi:hypothetical protein
VTTFAERLNQTLRITTTKRANGLWTRVTLAGLHVPEIDRSPRFLLTTEGNRRLPGALFGRELAAKINEASQEKGRVFFAIDLDLQEEVAAISYHIPERSSDDIMITAIAPRVDGAAISGRLCVPMLKACVHQVGTRLNRSGRVLLRTGALGEQEATELYGFRRGPRSKGRSPGHLIQDADWSS